MRTLTGHPERAPENSSVEVRPLDFSDPAGLVDSLSRVTTLYNTYWVRFAHAGVDHSVAVRNSRTLIEAAVRAGVRKVVHVSILHPSSDSHYPYFRGKALVEEALEESGLEYAVLRPSVLFDEKGVLINNIAWLLRHVPIFGIGDGGHYRIRPTHVDDLARLAIEASAWEGNRVVDAVGPERPTFKELVEEIRTAVGSRSLIVSVPGTVLVAMSRALGLVVRDVILTKEEYRTMADGLADSDAPATGETRLSEWLASHAASLGTRYANELELHFRPAPPRPL